jgi:phosphatidylglycerol---prolipoprotein diacylglyceryl transferase
MLDRIYVPYLSDFIGLFLKDMQQGFSTFSICMLIAFLVGTKLLPLEYKKRGLVPEAADTVVFLGVLGTLVGAKIFYIFEIWDQIFVVPGMSTFPLTHWYGFQELNDASCVVCKNSMGLWSSLFSGGGLVFYGGFIFGTLFIYFFLKWNGYDLGHYYDGMAPTMSIGYAIGRLGCFVSGDGCYGFHTKTEIPLLVFNYGGAHPSGVPVWNTPVIEAGISFLFFLYFFYYARHQNFKKWSLFFQYLTLHGLARLGVEFLRVNKAVIPILDPPPIVNIPMGMSENVEFLNNYYWHGFSQSQLISIAFIFISLAFIVKLKLWQRNPK